MSSSLDILKLLAGLGIFLFGMLLIGESVKALSGRAFRRISRQVKKSPLEPPDLQCGCRGHGILRATGVGVDRFEIRGHQHEQLDRAGSFSYAF